MFKRFNWALVRMAPSFRLAPQVFRWDSLALILGLVFVVSMADIAQAGDTYAIKARRAYTGSSPPVVDDAVLFIEDGKITRVGSALEIPPGMPVLDLSDSVIIPGLVASDSSLVKDRDNTESIGTQYRSLDSWDSYADYRGELYGGVTTAYLNPGRDRLVSGQGAVVKLSGHVTLNESSDVAVNFHSGVFDAPNLGELAIPPSDDVPIVPGVPQMPNSPMSLVAAIKEAIAEAQEGADPWSYSMEELKGILDRKGRWRITAHEGVYISQAIELASFLNRPVVLSGVQQAVAYADKIAKSGVSVIVEIPIPGGELPVDQGGAASPPAFDSESLSALRAAGVKIAISVGSNGSISDLMTAAAMGMQSGLSRVEALEAVTSHSASAIGVGDRLGSLSQGKDADFVVLGDEPFEPWSKVQRVFVDGKEVLKPTVDDGKRSIVIRAETLLAGDGHVYQPGALLIENGRIASVGSWVGAPRGARVIDGGEGSFLAPGFIDGHSHLGFVGDNTQVDTTFPIAISLGSDNQETRRLARSGVTTVCLTPIRSGNSGGRIAAVKTLGVGDSMIVDDFVGLRFTATNLDPLLGKATLQRSFGQGAAYVQKWSKYQEDLKKYEVATAKGEKSKAPEEPKLDEKLEPVRSLFNREAVAVVDVESLVDIRLVEELLVKEYGLRVVLYRAPSSAQAIDSILNGKMGVLLNPPLGDLAQALTRSGVSVGLGSGRGDGARGLLDVVRFATRQGLSPDEGLRLLTYYPARAMGIDDRVGTLSVGKDGDVLLFSGHPLHAGSHLKRVWVRGVEVPQT